jgi:hypothetical protein
VFSGESRRVSEISGICLLIVESDESTMYNLKRFNGTFKGNIGECLLKLTRDYLFLTRFHSRYKIIPILRKYLTEQQIKFLEENWFSIDGVEMVDFKPVLYEVKTKNRYDTPFHKKTKTTESTVRLFSLAKELGFATKLATVWLEENWDFSVELSDFNPAELYVDSPKQYDKK